MNKLLLLTFVIVLAACGESGSDSQSGGGLFQAGGGQNKNFFNIQLNSAKTFIESESIDITLTHSSILKVTGSPRVPITIGSTTAYANYLSGDNTKTLIFRYTVQAGDEDLNGIELSRSIDLNGGSIQYTVDGVTENATTELPNKNTSSYYVDTVSPKIEAITIPNAGYYKAGQVLSFVIDFNEQVTVVGSSKLELNINGSTINAALSSHSNDKLTYTYTTQNGDDDSDGIAFDNTSLVINSGSIVDGAGNLANLALNSLITPPSLANIYIDTTVPTVSIDSAPSISLGNASTYTFSGSCSEDGIDVDLTLENTSVTVSCGSGSWSSGAIDISGEADTTNFDLTATHSDLAGNAASATTTVVKDTSVSTVTITSPTVINSNNVSSYSLSGTCSEDTVMVDIFIGALNFQPTCSSNAWSLSGLDITSESDSASLAITADHSSATQATTTVVKDTTSPEVTSISAPTNGYYKSGDTLSFTIGFNENVIASSVASYIEIGLGLGTKQASYVSGSGTSSLVFTYTVQNGDNDTDGISISNSNIVLSSGSFEDNYGNSIDLALDKNISLPNLSSVIVDTSVPTVTLDSLTNITAANVSSYSVTGACSENSQTVNLLLGATTASATCNSGTYSATGIDLTGEADTATFNITADLDDLAGNSAIQATTTVDKNTTLPTVTISVSPDIDQTNVSSYSASGTCSENGQIVDINIGSVNIQPNCSSGNWSFTNLDLSSLSDGSISFTADHQSAALVSATQASTTVTKNTTGPTVTISSAAHINSSNESAYKVTGTCSENGRVVEVYIDSIYLTPNCNGGAWNTGNQDVSSLADSSSILITADHSNASAQAATQATITVVKDTSGPSMTSLSSPTTLKNAVNLSWTFVNPSAATIDDFVVNYRVKGTSSWIAFADGVSTNTYAQVTGLNPSTTYEFQVAVKYDSTEQSAFSQLTEAQTQPDSDLFAGDYIFMNLGGATATRVVAMEDNTRVFLNDVEIASSPLSAGQVASITSAQYDKLEGDKPIYAAGLVTNGGNNAQDKGNVMWVPTSWAGKNFNFNATRNNPQIVYIYAVENATITAKEGSTLLDSATLTAGQTTYLEWNNYGSFQITSTGTILAFSNSGGTNYFYDVKPLLPSSNEIIGFPSSSMTLTTDKDNTNYTYIHSNSVSASNVLDKAGNQKINPQGTSSLYQSHSLLITADQKIAGASYADSNGYCASPFLPTSMMKKKYMINTNSDYVAFASKEAGTIDVYSPGQIIGVDTPVQTVSLTRSGANTNAPFKVRLANQNSGYRYISTVNMAGWYQPNNDSGAADEDETILVGFD